MRYYEKNPCTFQFCYFDIYIYVTYIYSSLFGQTHKRPPKLAPRDPVSRERIVQKSNPTSSPKSSDDDDDELIFGKRKPKKEKEESLWEFLKNTSPDDPTGKIRGNDSKVDLPRRRGKTIDKLEPVSEKPKTPGSPRYIPLIPSSPSSPYQSDRINATINKTLSSSRASDDQSRSLLTPQTSSYLSSSLHHSKSLDQTQSSYYQNSKASKSTGYIQNSEKSFSSVPSKHKPRSESLDLLDDDLLYLEGQKKPKRKHEAQDLIDFLSTSPPKEYIFSNNDSVGNSGKKKEKKLKKLFSRLKKASFTDESTLNLNDQRSANSFSTTNTYRSSSKSNTSVNKPPRYVKIEIPKIPPKEDNQEQSIFDQVEIQGRHARQVSRASLSGSTRSLQYTPNRSTFSTTGGMASPTILEKEPSNSKLDSDDNNEHIRKTKDRSKQSQKSTISNNQQPMNTSNLSQSGTNNTLTSPARKIPSPILPSQQKSSYNNNVNNQASSQEINKNKVVPALSKEQKTYIPENISLPISASTSKRKPLHISAKALQNSTPPTELPSINSKNIIDDNEKEKE